MRFWKNSDGSCCCETPPTPPTPCCSFDCGETYVSSQHLTLTNKHGTVDLFPVYSRAGVGFTGPISGWQWFGVQEVPCDRTTKTWYQIGTNSDGSPAWDQECRELQAGTTLVSYSVTCEASAPGRLALLQGNALMCCGLGFDQYPPGSGGDGHYYAMRDLWVRTYTKTTAGNQQYPVIGFKGPTGDNQETFNGSVRGASTGGAYVSQDATSVTFDCGTENMDTQSCGSFVPVCVVGGIHAVTKPTYNDGAVSSFLYLDDGFAPIPMIWNGPRPSNTAFNNSQAWWGCVERTVNAVGATANLAENSSLCDPSSYQTITATIIYRLSCVGPTAGYKLTVYHDWCGEYAEAGGLQIHIRKPRRYVSGSSGPTIENDKPCTYSWVSVNEYPVGGSTNGLPVSSCDPFVWGPHSQTFPDTYPRHPLRGIHGETATWTITSQ